MNFRKMGNINIAEMLRNSPKGTKLYSPIFGDVYLDKIRPHLAIVVTIGSIKEDFLYDGRYSIDGECMLFPSKDQRDWSKFQRPFKDGDIVVSYLGSIHILKDSTTSYCNFNSRGYLDTTPTRSIEVIRFATEKETQKLFAAIKASGYKWNAETKTLERLIKPKFKVGNVIQGEDGYKVKITEVNVEDECYGYESIIAKGIGGIGFNKQDNWKLVPNKFDITTLKPFDKVLVRDLNASRWAINLFGFYADTDNFPFKCCGPLNIGFVQCIPYKGNEHLLGTINDCDDYYKIWK